VPEGIIVTLLSPPQCHEALSIPHTLALVDQSPFRCAITLTLSMIRMPRVGFWRGTVKLVNERYRTVAKRVQFVRNSWHNMRFEVVWL
jgi:hypothetical protein